MAQKVLRWIISNDSLGHSVGKLKLYTTLGCEFEGDITVWELHVEIDSPV
jgi:hypothetical protein